MQDCETFATEQKTGLEFVLETTLMEKFPHGQLALEFGPSNM
jgi:hypothetical protein